MKEQIKKQPNTSERQFRLGDHFVRVQLNDAPQPSDLLFELFSDQFKSKLSWLTASCSLIIVFYAHSIEQIAWSARLVLSFVCSLVVHLIINTFYAFCLAGSNPQSNQTENSGNVLERDKFKIAAGYKKNRSGHGDPLKLRSDTTRQRNWLNFFLNEIWPRACSNYKLDNSERSAFLGRFVCLNKLNFSKTKAPTVERLSLVNRLDTPNGQLIVLELIVLIDWSTPDHDTLLSLSLFNLQFTISSLHSISARLRLCVCLHFATKRPNDKLYKMNVSLLERPTIWNYKTSGAVYLLQVLHLHLLLVDWLLSKFLLFPRTLLILLDHRFFELDSLAERLEKNSFFDLDLDDLKNLIHQHKHINFFEQLATPDSEQIESNLNSYRVWREKMCKNQTNCTETKTEQDLDKNLNPNLNENSNVNPGENLNLDLKRNLKMNAKKEENGEKDGSPKKEAPKTKIRSKESDKSEKMSEKQISKDKKHKLEQLKKMFNCFIKDKIARYVLHLTVMYGLNVPAPKSPSNPLHQASPSYFVRIRINNLKFTTGSHLTKESIFYWMQSFIIAAARLNCPVYLTVLVGQASQQASDQTKNEQEIGKTRSSNQTTFRWPLQTESVSLASRQEPIEKIGQIDVENKPEKRVALKLSECFEIKLTNNLEQFLNSHNLNGRLYTVEDEFSKCRVTVRFSVFNLRLSIYKTPTPPFILMQEQQNYLNDALATIGLPVGVLSLFVSHITNIEFISDPERENTDQFCWLNVSSLTQEHMFRSKSVGDERCCFERSCFLLLFRPSIEMVQFKLYFARSQKANNCTSAGQSGNAVAGQGFEPVNFPIGEQNEPNESPNEEPLLDWTKTNLQSLAWCSLSPSRPTHEAWRPQYKKIKLNGWLTDSYLHVCYCYNEITQSAKRLLQIMMDSEKTCLNYIQNTTR